MIQEGTERRFAHLTLQGDPFFHRLPPEKRQEAVDFGLASGQAAVNLAVTRYGRDPESIAKTLQISVIRSDEQAKTGPMVYFSEYREKPPTITLYQQSLDEADQLIQDHYLEDFLGLVDIEPMHFVHELYHHLEAKKIALSASRFRFQTFRLGPLRFRTGLPSLNEIAADRFAMGLLGLKVAPKATQFITIYAHNIDYAWSLLDRLRELPL